jgi:hypothetical protein
MGHPLHSIEQQPSTTFSPGIHWHPRLHPYDFTKAFLAYAA